MRAVLEERGVTTLRIQIGSNLWARYSRTNPTRLVVLRSPGTRASELAELYLLLARWVERQALVVVQEGANLAPFQSLNLRGVTWEGGAPADAGVFMVIPTAEIRRDNTLDTLHTWLAGLRQPEPFRLAVEKIIVE